MKRLVWLVVAIGLAGAGCMAYAWHSPIPPVDRLPASAFDRETVAAGGVLAALGNCVTCHSKDGGTPYAGGRAIETPFGTISAPNITPDPETGIGRWSEAAFVRAVRHGVSRDGQHLYPAFPYDHMSRTSEADVKAVYAFLMTRQPVASRRLPNTLAFPYNIRPLLAGWKLLFLDTGERRPDVTRSAEWNRGAYLVEGLAHCGSCHTPRNRFGAEDKSNAYGGGEVSGWIAPALGPTSQAAVPWSADRLYDYLRRGQSPLHGVAAGPMAPVIRNLAAVPDADIKAMATYVAAIAGPPTKERTALADRALARANGEAPARVSAAIGDGNAIYAGACAQCHGEAGRTPLTPALNLALSTSVRAGQPNNLVRVILGGIAPADNEAGPRMPGFGSALTDKQVADLVDFVRASFTDRPAFANVDMAVRKAR